jgi:TonB family protein
MLEDSAEAAVRLRKFDAAQKLLEAALAIRGEENGQQSVEYAIGLIKLGDFERRRNQLQAAGSFYRRAIQILRDRQEAAAPLIHLGVVALGTRDFQTAFDYFEHAQRVDPAQAGVALMWMGVARERLGAIPEAEALYKQALGIQDPNSSQAATTMRIYAQFLRSQSRQGEAADLDARATAVQNARVAIGNPKLSEGVYRMGHAITPPSVLQKVEPEYSEEARIAKITGTVVVEAEIGTDGVAHNIHIKRGIGMGLDEKGIEAVQQWRFRPGTRINDGEPVAVLVNIEINFRLL